MNTDHLAALVAVVDEGSFEAAARALHITPSAVSQRIKALEKHHGRVLVVRASPCRATTDGEVLLRLARQIAELRADAYAELDPDPAPRRPLPVVVNADSLATWFEPVFDEVATWPDVALELFIEVEDHGTHYLRTGEAVAAVTSDPVVVPGCTTEPLGVLRYVPVATPELAERHTRGGRIDWQGMPMVRFSDKDDLQHRLLHRHGVQDPAMRHLVPSNQAFFAAVRAGMGWGLISEPQLGDSLDTGDLVRLGTNEHVDVELAWQSWRLGSETTARLTQAVHRAARRGLRQGAGGER